MSIWGAVKGFIMKMLRIQPAINDRIITIREPFSYEANVLKNRIWYRGDPCELDQFFKQSASGSGEQFPVLGSCPFCRPEHQKDSLRTAGNDGGPAG